MKRLLALILAAAMMFSFAACSVERSDSEDLDNDKGNGSNKSDSLSDSVDEIDFEETVVIDNEICKVTIKDIKPHEVNYEGTAYYAITTSLTNKSNKKAQTFDILESYVNGLYCPYDGINIWTVEKGKTEEVDIIIWHSDLEKLSEFGVSEFTDFEMQMNVSDEWFHVYPLGKEKVSFYTRNNPDDTVVTDSEQATVKVIGFEETDEYYIMNMYLSNKNPNESREWFRFNLFCSIDDIYPENTTEWILPAGKSRFAVAKWKKTDLNQKAISTSNEIKLSYIVEGPSGRIIDDVVIVNP